ncbi:cobalamin B12-binding domain-containing protein [Engelhardtia mirabilis]|uniref:Methionine synthase n=1 Tax=Engelhardtia mirabilis TaxID=2528011 RepID=A0A518BGE5_9BACT|nr:Methionine synthase [Planctomycetes bacterium Pla133]QDV00386.1 Methionine synthase [Planctomycetes bacterium Pla86]
MDQRGQFVAGLIDASRRALAAGAAARLADEGGGVAVQDWGFQRLVSDLQARLHALAEALASGRPELLELDLSWLAAGLCGRGLELDTPRAALNVLVDELREGLPDGAGDLAADCLAQGLPALRVVDCVEPVALDGSGPHDDLLRRFVLALLEARREDAERLILDALDQGVSVAEIHGQVLTTTQRELGRMWVAGEVNVAEEHYASRVVEGILTLLRHRAPSAPASGRTVLLASVEGNLHDLGGQIIADQLELAGYRTVFLGSSVPTPDLVEALGHFGADVLGLSAGLGLHVRATAKLVKSARAAHPDLPILVGGGPFNLVPGLWRTVGADGWAQDAPGAVDEVRRLLG